MLELTEVTPILNLFPTGNNAEIRAAIENGARAFSIDNDKAEEVIVDVNNSDGDSGDLFGVVDRHSYFGNHPNPNPNYQFNIEGEFIAQFCSLQKCSEKYPKAKKVDIFYQALTCRQVEDQSLANPPPGGLCEILRMDSSHQVEGEVGAGGDCHFCLPDIGPF